MGAKTIEFLIMQRTVVINIVGLSKSILHLLPFVNRYAAQHQLRIIAPMLPAVTTSVQSTYLTGKWPAQTGIVGNEQVGRLDEGFKARNVDHLPGDHVIGDSGQACDFGGDRSRRLLKPTIDARDVANHTRFVEGEGDHTDFDDFIGAVVEAGGFGVEDHAAAPEFRPWVFDERPR